MESEETEASKQYREAREREAARQKARADKEDAWRRLESGKRARAEALAKLMGGGKPPKKAPVEARRAGRGAKAALRSYARWAQDSAFLDESQRAALAALIGEWRGIKASSGTAADFPAAPPRARLKELHAAIARRGVGNTELWGRYVSRVREVESATDPRSGRPKAAPAAVAPEPPDEEYRDDRKFVAIEDINEMMRVRWTETREREERAAEEARRTEALVELEKKAVEAKRERAQHKSVDLDDDGFVVSTTPQVLDVKPAVLDGYTWTDDSERVVLYVELSRPARAHDLDVRIQADTLEISHRESRVLRRSFFARIEPRHEDSVWYLEDGGDVLRFELVKETGRGGRDDDDDDWPMVFKGDDHDWRRTTKTNDERFVWKQTDVDISVSLRVPRGTTKYDVSVAMRRDTLRVYVKKAGVLIDGTLNRDINVPDSTWCLEGVDLTLSLSKLEKDEPWQRLMSGGNQIGIREAYEQMADQPPEHGDPDFLDLEPAERAYVTILRELDRAKAAGDDALVQDLTRDLDAFSLKLDADIDRPHRKAILKAMQ
ncbi:hypothetical protein CTAYLR_006262 [Chrysophaeum taylorii]|uniref:CS domain-containing protein n=1 Tax=Chrysophaeum taylorii TaxID=2483200 RepID=A0AAD7UKD5_9STRA|nr:hypothetical protein CTAYLR_006262 [Chrysophaeum taylorii]